MVMQNKYPSFEESMKYSLYYKNRTEDTEWSLLRERYEDWTTRKDDKQLIPKIIHQIWLGREMPDFEKRMTKQVREKLGSDWEYKIWSEREISHLKNFKNRDLFEATPNFGQKSDLLRYAILNEYGGVYLDTDFLLVTNFNDLLNIDFFCGVAYDTTPTMFNGLIGSSPGNIIIEDLLTLDTELRYSDAMSLMDSTGPFFLTRRIFKHLPNIKNLVVFPNSFFYPLPNFEINKSHGNDYKAYLAPESICCHMWSSSWM